MRDSNPIQISRNRENRGWFAGPPHRGSHSPTRGHGRRASRRPLSTRSRRRLADAPASCPPSFRTMDGFASRRNCSSSPAPRLAPIVIRKAANCSVEKREGKRCPQRALYGPWAVALVILLVSGGLRGCTGTDEAIYRHGHGRVEPFDRSAGPRFSSDRPDFRACGRLEGVVPARRPGRATASGSGVIVDPDGYIVTNPRRKRCAAAARRYPTAGHRRLDSRGAKPHRRRGDCRHRSRNGSRGNQGRRAESRYAAVRQLRRSARRSARPGIGSPLGLDNSVSLGVVSAIARQLELESPMIYVQTEHRSTRAAAAGRWSISRPHRRDQHADSAAGRRRSDGLGFSAPSNIVRTVRADPADRTGAARRDRSARADRHPDPRARSRRRPRERRRPGRCDPRQPGGSRGSARRMTSCCRSTASRWTTAVNCRSIVSTRSG